MRFPAIGSAVEQILHVRRAAPPDRAVLIGISGIDGSGKGHVTRLIAAAVTSAGQRVAAIGADAWLNLPDVRFDAADPAAHFYRHAIRFEEMFRDVVLPLRDTRSVRADVEVAEETSTSFIRRTYDFSNIDVVIVEGIFLFKRELRAHYDFTIWVECSFETAMERALARAQEGLSPEDTAAAYGRIYFPAQELHFARDNPRVAAHGTLANDAEEGIQETAGTPSPSKS